MTNDAFHALAVSLLRQRRLSVRRAAELAGRSVPELMDDLGFGDLPFFTPEDAEVEELELTDA